nr:hypothetical protein [Burkholderia sp. MSMB1498]
MRAGSAACVGIGARAAGCGDVAAALRVGPAVCCDGVNDIGRLRTADTAACVAGRRGAKRWSGVAGRASERLPIAATAAVEPIGFAMPAEAGTNVACGVAGRAGEANNAGEVPVPSGAAAPPAEAALAVFRGTPAGIVAPAGFTAPVAGVAETGVGAFAAPAPLPCIAKPAAFGTPLAGDVEWAAFGAMWTGIAAPAVFAGSPVGRALPVAFANPGPDASGPAAFVAPLAAVPAAPAVPAAIAAAGVALRGVAPGLSQPAGAVGSAAAFAAPLAPAWRRSPRCASFGRHSVGRE